MPRKKTKAKSVETTDFRHESAKRTNIPPAKIAGEGKVPDVDKQQCAYSPHLSPVLRFDPEARADKVEEAVEKACAGKSLANEEKVILRAVAANWKHPWLEWAGKKEEHDRQYRSVDPVALHIHERVSANAILNAAKRKDVERSLFADPELEYQQAVQFYKHDMDWANRLILGDSLEVMSSLVRREGLSGRVQMIYVDPPYGIKFASNFQPEVGSRDVTDKISDLTREPEMVRAYRDTWSLGLHSYLSYLRDRLILARDLLRDSGSIFVQISDENLHRVRQVLDEVFGPQNFLSVITYATTSSQTDNRLAAVGDFLLWYAKDRNNVKYRQLFHEKELGGKGAGAYGKVESLNGSVRGATKAEKEGRSDLPEDASVFRLGDLTSSSPGTRYPVVFEGKEYNPKGYWKTEQRQMPRLIAANRVASTGGKNLYYRRYIDDFAAYPLSNNWPDTVIAGFASDKRYVVETSAKVIQRCILLATDPGDLVLDPTCGSGTTAYVAEKWGRRWITIDTSRVALSLARQRLLTGLFDRYRLKGEGSEGAADASGMGVDPSADFVCKQLPHKTLGSIARNENLDPIFERHELILNEQLARVNQALCDVADELREQLVGKLAAKMQGEGIRAATDADRRRWLLPGTSKDVIAASFAGKPRLKPKHVKQHLEIVPSVYEHWHVPFDTDPDWPAALAASVSDYRKAWRAKMDEINACIEANAEQERLLDRPEVLEDVVRVTGPFTVEGVMPEELSVGKEGLFDGTPNAELDHAVLGEEGAVEAKNVYSYLESMLRHLGADGVTFPDNKNPKFALLEALFDSDSASVLHAEGIWEGGDEGGPASVGVGFGPQYGPITARQVEDLIREASRRGYDELVVAGFSFDAEAHAIIQEASHPKLQIHLAQIRPDLNAGMQGLLKDTPNSQLFTVFGTPAVAIEKNGDEWAVTLEGVDIYDPVKNTVQSTGASKVAGWFLDSDFDGRCFCITQAFFPDQDSWEKLAKALKDVIEPDSFAAFKGTTSLPFKAGVHGRIAVKVIDPRGSEVMTVHKLEG